MPWHPEKDPTFSRAMLSTLRTVASVRDPAAITRSIQELAMDWIGDRAYLLFHDPEGHALWSALDDDFAADCSRGLAGLALSRTDPIVLSRATEAPTYEVSIDDPEGQGEERIAAIALRSAPIVELEAHAVLIVVRESKRDEFKECVRGRLIALARGFAPILDQMVLEARLGEGTTLEIELGAEDLGMGLYRAEALEAHRGSHAQGQVLVLESPWLGILYRLVVALVMLSLAYLCLVDVGEYSSGLALVRLGGRTEVRASTAGSVVEVLVASGDEVQAGQILIRLYDVDDADEAERLEQEFELQLRNLLRDPNDAMVQQAVTSLRAERERTNAHLRKHMIRAPRSGIVRDLRVKQGQALEAGEMLISIASEEIQPHVIALLPGDDRPRIDVGMTLVFEIDGYRDAEQALRIDHVYEDVIGPAEALRVLGPEIAADLSISGPVVLVRATLPEGDFESKSTRYHYHDGMRGHADVEVRSHSLLEALVPSLEAI